MASIVDTLAAGFQSQHDTKEAAKKAADAKTDAGNTLADVIAASYRGNMNGQLPDNYRDQIAMAYERVYSKKIPDPSLSEYASFAEWAARGIYDQAKTAWTDWAAWCKAEDKKTGTQYTTLRDMIRNNESDHAVEVFEYSAAGIFDFLAFKRANIGKFVASIETAVKGLVDLENDEIDVGVVAKWCASMREKFPNNFKNKKAKKAKSRPPAKVTVEAETPAPQTPPPVVPVAGAPTNVVTLNPAAPNALEQFLSQLPAGLTEKQRISALKKAGFI